MSLLGRAKRGAVAYDVHPVVQSALAALANLSHNNPAGQVAAMESRATRFVIGMCDPSMPPEIAMTAVLCLGNLVADNSDACARAAEAGAVERLIALVSLKENDDEEEGPRRAEETSDTLQAQAFQSLLMLGEHGDMKIAQLLHSIVSTLQSSPSS
jgi:hypothetical protein